tara:strand:+ start:2031 stop:2621 length:591 start_codon:yes stop_codon:yes gene_type:complete
MLKAGFVGFAPGAAGTLGTGSTAGALGASLVGPTAGTTGLVGASGSISLGSSLINPLKSNPLVGSAKSAGASAGKGNIFSTIGGYVKDGVVAGVKSTVATATGNLLMYGDVRGDVEGPDPLYRRGDGSAFRSISSYSLPEATEYTPLYSSASTDTVGNTYVAMLQNLGYGNGSYDYAVNNNIALMQGITIPQIQYG